MVAPSRAQKRGKLPRKLARFKKLFEKDPLQSPTDIALKAYNCKDRHVASVIASQCLKKLGINLTELFDRAGLGDEYDITFLEQKLKAKKVVGCNINLKTEDGQLLDASEAGLDIETIKVEDHDIQLKAFQVKQRLQGRLRNDKSSTPPVSIILNYGYRVKRAGSEQAISKHSTVRGRRKRKSAST